MIWDAYYNLASINAWIDDLAKHFPNIVTVIDGGTSYENRTIKGLKISHGEGRRAIFLEGGIHSREWISPATVTYITNELLTQDDEEIKAAAQGFDWYIFPVTNPDGYVWSFENVIHDFCNICLYRLVGWHKLIAVFITFSSECGARIDVLLVNILVLI